MENGNMKTRGKKIDVDALFKKDGYEPPKINLDRAIKKAMRSGKARVPEFTYLAVAKALGMTNANNVAKWFNGDGLSFNTIKMILYVLNCGIEDLIEPPTKKKNKNS